MYYGGSRSNSSFSEGRNYNRSSYLTSDLGRTPAFNRVLHSDYVGSRRDYSASRLPAFRPLSPAPRRRDPMTYLSDEISFASKPRSYYDFPSTSAGLFSYYKKPKRIDYTDYFRPVVTERPTLKSDYCPRSRAERESVSNPIVRERKLIKFRETSDEVLEKIRRKISWDLPEEISSPFIDEMKQNVDALNGFRSRENSLSRRGSNDARSPTPLSRRSSAEPLVSSGNNRVSTDGNFDSKLEDRTIYPKVPVPPPRKKSIGSTHKFKRSGKKSIDILLSEEKSMNYSLVADNIRRNREMSESKKAPENDAVTENQVSEVNELEIRDKESQMEENSGEFSDAQERGRRRRRRELLSEPKENSPESRRRCRSRLRPEESSNSLEDSHQKVAEKCENENARPVSRMHRKSVKYKSEGLPPQNSTNDLIKIPDSPTTSNQKTCVFPKLNSTERIIPIEMKDFKESSAKKSAKEITSVVSNKNLGTDIKNDSKQKNVSSSEEKGKSKLKEKEIRCATGVDMSSKPVNNKVEKKINKIKNEVKTNIAKLPNTGKEGNRNMAEKGYEDNKIDDQKKTRNSSLPPQNNTLNQELSCSQAKLSASKVTENNSKIETVHKSLVNQDSNKISNNSEEKYLHKKSDEINKIPDTEILSNKDSINKDENLKEVKCVGNIEGCIRSNFHTQSNAKNSPKNNLNESNLEVEKKVESVKVPDLNTLKEFKVDKLQSKENIPKPETKGVTQLKSSDISSEMKDRKPEKESHASEAKLNSPKSNEIEEIVIVCKLPLAKKVDASAKIKSIPDDQNIVVSIKNSALQNVKVLENETIVNSLPIVHEIIPEKLTNISKLESRNKESKSHAQPEVNVTHTIVLKPKTQQNLSDADKTSKNNTLQLKPIPDILKSAINAENKLDDIALVVKTNLLKDDQNKMKCLPAIKTIDRTKENSNNSSEALKQSVDIQSDVLGKHKTTDLKQEDEKCFKNIKEPAYTKNLARIIKSKSDEFDSKNIEETEHLSKVKKCSSTGFDDGKNKSAENCSVKPDLIQMTSSTNKQFSDKLNKDKEATVTLNKILSDRTSVIETPSKDFKIENSDTTKITPKLKSENQVRVIKNESEKLNFDILESVNILKTEDGIVENNNRKKKMFENVVKPTETKVAENSVFPVLEPKICKDVNLDKTKTAFSDAENVKKNVTSVYKKSVTVPDINAILEESKSVENLNSVRNSQVKSNGTLSAGNIPITLQEKQIISGKNANNQSQKVKSQGSKNLKNDPSGKVNLLNRNNNNILNNKVHLPEIGVNDVKISKGENKTTKDDTTGISECFLGSDKSVSTQIHSEKNIDQGSFKKDAKQSLNASLKVLQPNANTELKTEEKIKDVSYKAINVFPLSAEDSSKMLATKEVDDATAFGVKEPLSNLKNTACENTMPKICSNFPVEKNVQNLTNSNVKLPDLHAIDSMNNLCQKKPDDSSEMPNDKFKLSEITRTGSALRKIATAKDPEKEVFNEKVTLENQIESKESTNFVVSEPNKLSNGKERKNLQDEGNEFPSVNNQLSSVIQEKVPEDRSKYIDSQKPKPSKEKRQKPPRAPPAYKRYGLFVRPKEPPNSILESSSSDDESESESESSKEKLIPLVNNNSNFTNGRSPDRNEKTRTLSETSNASIYSTLSNSTICTTFSTSSLDEEDSSPKTLKFRKYDIKDFVFFKLLGKGSFGKVLLAELKDSGMYFAIKCLKKDVVLEDDDVESTMIERRVLALGTQHPYMCKLYCTFQTKSYLYFVMEYLNGGDLMFHIQENGRFEEKRAMFYGAEIVSALKFLHKRGIVYRDTKLDNVMLDEQGHVRLVDFGMCQCRIYKEECMPSNFCGTPAYIAPEIILGQKYNQSVDWWSFGVLLYEMLIGRSPFQGTDEDELFWSICNEEPHYPRFLSKEAVHILGLLLVKSPCKRLGMPSSPSGDIKDHAFFREIDWDKIEKKLIAPPFKPSVSGPCDTSNFDSSFTTDAATLSPVDSEVLKSMDQHQFQGFSYTNPHLTG